MKNRHDHKKIVKISGPKKKKVEKTLFSEEDLQLTRLPADFEFTLLTKMVYDLLSDPSNGEDPEFRYDVDWYLDDIMKTIRSKDPQRLKELSGLLSPQSICGSGVRRPDIFYRLYQIGALLKKFPFAGDQAKANALKAFYRQEVSNRLFNECNHKAVIALSLRHPYWDGCLEEIRADIKKLIGEKPPLELVFRMAQHGPGTSVGFEGAEGKDTTFFKWLTLPYTVSPAAYPYAQTAIESHPQWMAALQDHYRQKHGLTVYQPINMDLFWSYILKVVDFCRYTSVPKTFDIERGIAIEPTLNVYIQLGVKSVLYARLKNRWDIDLTDQSWNQELALSSSKTDDLVTVDLKGASNSVTVLAACMLLPVEWFDFLDDLRSRNIKIPLESDPRRKTINRTEMFSAMGNGFTFAIETIIFAALARYAMRKTGTKGSMAVYGDDIIIPQPAYKVLHELLLLFGFQINEDKTFVNGPFRESCGADCLLGYDVTPFKLDKPIRTIRDLWKLHNSLVLVEHRLPWFYQVSFRRTLGWLRSLIPHMYRGYRGPVSESVDNYLFIDSKEWKSQGDGTYAWLGITTRPVTFNNRSDSFEFRRLMADYRPRPEWKVLDPVTNGGSVFDITIRNNVRHVRTSFTGYY